MSNDYKSKYGSNYQSRYKTPGNNISNFLSSVQQNDEDRTLDIQNQIDNYKQRLSIAGYDPNDVADGRNFVERALNLPENQKWFMDALELLGRPGKSLIGAVQAGTDKRKFEELTEDQKKGMSIDAINEYNSKKPKSGSATAGDIARGFMDGLSGQNKEMTSGKQIVSDIFRDGNKSDKLDLTSFAGFGIEMFLDPVRWAMFAATGGSSEVANASGAMAKASVIAKGIVRGSGKKFVPADTISKSAEQAAKLAGLKTATDSTDSILELSKLLGKQDMTSLAKNISSGVSGSKPIIDNVNISGELAKTLGKNTLELQTQAVIKTLDSVKDVAKMSRMPQSVHEIYKLTQGKEVTGRMAKIALAEGPLRKTGSIIGGGFEVAGRLTNPNWWVTSAHYNATHVTALQKGMSSIKNFAGAARIAGIDFATNKYMQGVSNLMETDSALALKKAQNYLNLEETYNNLTGRINQFANRRAGYHDGSKKTMTVESGKQISKFATASEDTLLKLAKDLDPDFNPEFIKELIAKPEKLQELMLHLKEGQQTSITWTIDTFIDRMTKATGSGEGIPYSKSLFDGLNKLTKGKPEVYGIRFVDAATKTGEAIPFGARPSIIFDKDIWNTANKNKLLSDFMRLNPQDGMAAVADIKGFINPLELVLTNEMPDWVNDVALNLDKSKSLAPIKELLGTFNETYNEILKIQGKNLFGDELYGLKNTKELFGESFVSHSKSEYGKKLSAYMQSLEDLGPTPANRFDGMSESQKATAMAKESMDLANRQQEAMARASKLSGADGKVGSNLFSKQAAVGNLKELKTRGITGTTFQSNKYMTDYLDDLYRDPNYFKMRFPSATVEHQKELLDMIKGGDWFNVGADQSLKHLGDTITSSLSKASLAVELSLGEAFDGVSGGYRGLRAIPNGERVPIGLKAFDPTKAKTLLSSLNIAENYSQAPAVAELSELIRASLYNGTPLYIDGAIEKYVTMLTKSSADELMLQLNAFTNDWKKLKVLSPSYQARNVFGNIFNSYISGQNVGDTLEGIGDARQTVKALGSVDDGKGILWKISKNMDVTDSELKMYDMWKNMNKAGFLSDDFAYRLQGIETEGLISKVDRWDKPLEVSKNPIKRGIDWASKHNMRLNQTFDDLTRISTYNYAIKHPEYLTNLGVKSAVEAVGLVHFDTTNLMDVEANFIRKIVPFYNFNRQNVAFQAKNIMNNPDRVRDFTKGFEAWWTEYAGVDKDEMASYERENLYLPLGRKKEDGTYKTIKSNLPLADVMGYLANPLGEAVSALNPIIRMPFELGVDQDFFTGKKISEDAISVSKYILGLTGYDTPLRLPQGIIQAAMGDTEKYAGKSKSFQKEFTGGPVKGLETVFSLTSQGNTNVKETNELYEEFNRLKAYFKMLKDAGMEIPTITEMRRMGLVEKKPRK